MMSKEKWVESLIDDMIDSQWGKDIISQEFERFNKLGEEDLSKSVEDLEPINRYSAEELEQSEKQDMDFKSQIENFSKTEYEDYLIDRAVNNIQEDYFEEVEFSDEYIENLIRQHLDEEKDFLDMVMKEAIAEEGYFQEHVERHFQEEHDFYSDEDYVEYAFEKEVFDDFDDNDYDYMEYPSEKEVFDDLGDTSYMDQGIYEGADTDSLEEPFTYVYYENPFIDDDLLDYAEEDLHENLPDADVGEVPDDLILREPENDNLMDLICERLFEEKHLDKVFVEIIKKEEYWDRIIRDKLAGDEKLNTKLKNWH